MASDGRFVLPAPALWPAYEGTATLNEMIVAAAGRPNLERSGLHPLIVGNPRVIDVEVAFRSVAAHQDPPASDEPETNGITEELAAAASAEMQFVMTKPSPSHSKAALRGPPQMGGAPATSAPARGEGFHPPK